jgi:Fe-Mn family superoxide dismutase
MNPSSQTTAQACSLDQLANMPAGGVFDVRRAATFANASTMIPNATWRDPAQVQEWGRALGKGQAVIVYCVFEHEVSQNTALALQAQGVNARFLDGGIDAWEKAGYALVAKAKAEVLVNPL